MSLLDSILGQLGGEAMNRIGGQLGADPQSASKATGTAVATLLAALSKNASSNDGAEALHTALQKDHDGSALDDLGGILQGAGSADGEAILRHVLGSRRDVVERGIGQSTGLDSSKAGNLLAMLAPVVLGALGRQQRQQGLGASDLGALLGQERQTIERRDPKAAGVLGALLDSDGDGDVDLSDMLRHGSGLLGKFFKT